MSILFTLSQLINDLGTPAGGSSAGGGDAPLPLPSFGAALARMVGSLAIVLGVLAVVLFVLRRRLGTRSTPGRQLQVVESIGIGPRQRLLLVKIGERRVALATTEQSITVIPMSGDTGVATDTSKHSTFADAWSAAGSSNIASKTGSIPDAQKS